MSEEIKQPRSSRRNSRNEQPSEHQPTISLLPHNNAVHLPQQVTLEPMNNNHGHMHFARREQEHKMDIDRRILRADFDLQQHSWRSCCFNIDKRAVAHFSQLFLSTILVLFCIVMIVLHATECNNVYFGFLGVVGGFQLGRVSSW